MNYFVRRPWDLPVSQITDEAIYHDKASRRQFLKSIGITSLSFSAALAGCKRASIEEIDKAGQVSTNRELYPAPSNELFEYGRSETLRRDAA